MFFLILTFAVCALIWALAIAKHVLATKKVRPSFALPGVGVLVVGSVFGYDFFNLDSGPIPLTLDRLLLAGLCAVFVVLVIRRRVSVRLPDATDCLVFALLTALLLSALMTDWSYNQNRPISRWLFFYLMPATLYFLVRQTNLSDTDLKWVSLALVAFGLYLGLTSIFESRGWYSLVFPTYIRDESSIEFFGRGRGPFLNPISNGIYITCCLGAALLLVWHQRFRARLIVLVTLPLLFAGGIATLTRSVWVGMAASIGLLVWIPANRQQRGLMIVLAAFIGVIGLFAVGDKLIKFKRDKHVTENQMSQSAQLRPIFAFVAYEMFQEQPFQGCGFGQYGRARLKYVQYPNTNYEMRKAKDYLQHNVFLSFLTETGLIGLSLLLLLLLKGIQISIMLFRNPQASSWARGYALMLISVLVSYSINGLFHDVSIIPMANMLLFFLIGIVANRQAAFSTDLAAAVNKQRFETVQRLNTGTT